MSVNVICSMTLFIGAFAALYLRGIGWRRINPFHPLNLGWSLELGLHLRTLLIFDNWGFAWVSHRSGIDYHWWHSCILYCAWYNMYTTVGKSQGCRRTQKTFSWIQNFSRIMRLHQGYFFDFSYSQSVQTELKKWTVIFPCLQATTQWRKVQERLEDDERCSRLEKIVRLNIFQVSIFLALVNFCCSVVQFVLYVFVFLRST